MGLALALAVMAADPPADTQQPANNSAMIWVLMGGLVIAMFFFSRRAKKKAGDPNAFRSSLAPGQRVMTMSGMIGMVSRVDGDVITIMSGSGDESAWLRRAVRSVVTDEEWEAMTAEYSDDEDDAEETPKDSEAPEAIEENTPEIDEPGKDG